MARSSAIALILFGVSSLAGTQPAALPLLPLRFEANAGQADPGIQFMARSNAGTVLLRSQGMVLKARRGQSILFDLAGRIAPAAPEPLEPLASRSNYFLGRDPAKWRRDLPNYGRVRYRHVWPGIDLIYYGSANRLEYDFVVAPGADPRAIGFAVRGAGSIRLAPDGDLLLASGIRQHKPRIYQETASGRHSIAGGYALEPGNRIRFRIGTYDRALPLIVDPVISYSTLFGGSGNDGAAGIAVDSAGSAYITGVTESTDLPAGVAGSRFIGTPPDVFVAKLTPDGTNLVYCTYIGGEDDDEARAIAVDPAGNAYITGITFSTRFPVTGGTVQTVYGLGKGDAFVAKIGPNGALVYATYLGGLGADEGRGIAADASGNAYVTGITSSGNFPLSLAAYQSRYQGGAHDGFVAKLGPAGTALVYSTFLGSSGDDQPAGIAIDPAGNAYVTGSTDAADFPTTATAYQTTASNPVSVSFVTKLNPAGAPAYSTYLGGDISDAAKSIAVDFAGNAYIAGVTSSDNYPTTTGALKVALSGSSDAFVTKLNAAGNDLVYSTFLGGSDTDGATAIGIDLVGNAYVAGDTRSADFPFTPTLQAARGGVDGFIVKLDSKGATLVYASYIGGAQDEHVSAVAVDPLSNAYVTGNTLSFNFSVTPGALRASLAAQDAFVVKVHDVDLPLLTSDTSSLTFAYDVLGSPPAAQTVKITSTTGPVTISALSDGALWLVVGPASAPTPATINVSVDPARVTLGTYKANVVISASGAANSPVTIPVEFDMTRSGLPGAPPSGLTPGTIPAGSGDTTITINGSGFVRGSVVQVNGVAVDTTFLNAGTLTAVIPASLLAMPGTLALTVVNPGQNAAALSLSLTVSAVLPAVADGGVLNAASLLPGTVAPGELVVILGNNLGPADAIQATADGGSYPTTLGGTRVWFDTTAAPLLGTSAGQVVAVVPFGVSGGSTQFEVEFNGQKSNPLPLPVAAAAPGLFVAGVSGAGPASVINADGGVNSKQNPAIAGTMVTFLATGGGQTNPAGVDGAVLTDVLPQLILPVSMQMGGELCANVTAAPAAGMVSGILQITAQVPADLSGTVSAVLFIGGTPSQPGVTVEVQPPSP